jgi:dihydrofolate synthase/folylpolyglutamate synthase
LPTFFESTTAVAFELFREAGVDMAVLEVGLGGRLDATNIVSPIAAAIVSIDFDHEEQLGHTLASIAAEKAGVIKPGIPVVCGPVPDEVLAVIARVCAEQRATLVRTDTDAALAARLASMPIALRGEHQRANAAVALRLMEAIDADTGRGVRIDANAMRAGITTVTWPGRLETRTHGGCQVLLDAAHNPAGARALASYLQEAAPGGVGLVFAAMRDKAVREMLTILAPAAKSIVCTTAPSTRAMSADEIAALAAALGRQAHVIADPVAAVTHACGEGRLVVVAGSIFLIGLVREWLARDILR